MLLTQIHKESKINVVHVKLINVANIVGLHFFGGDSVKLDRFLKEEAADLVTFRKYFLAQFKQRRGHIVDEVGHFQPNFTLFINRLIQKLGPGNLVKSVNGDTKRAELFLNVRKNKDLIPRLFLVSGAADLFVSVVCRAVCVQSATAAPAPGHISDEISALADCFGSVAVAAPGQAGLSASMPTRVGKEALNPDAFSMQLRSMTKAASLVAQADSSAAPSVSASASPKPTGVIIELKSPYNSKKGLCGNTYSHQPISQAVLELELEARNGGVCRAMLTDGFILRMFFNTQKDGVSTHYMSTRVYEPEDYIAHLLFAFVSCSNEDLASNFEVVAADMDDADASVASEGEIKEDRKGPSPGSKSAGGSAVNNLKVGNQGTSASEPAVPFKGLSTGSQSGGGSKAVNENIYQSNRSRIDLNFQDKLDAYNDKIEKLKEADNRRLGLCVLTQSELERRRKRRPIDMWLLEGADVCSTNLHTQHCDPKYKESQLL